MPISTEHIQFLARLDAAPLPATVEDNASVEMVRGLCDAGLLQAILPPYDEATRSHSGPAWVIRLTHDGIQAARAPRRPEGSRQQMAERTGDAPPGHP
ncbi:hypothetical protein WKW79_35860 [Variovorax robiniae]|uniref:Uncharacterized protein n=1 Tax=Variovorax robiniae TaxID=1836199 RepID=A0ABU8XKD1_9BURK